MRVIFTGAQGTGKTTMLNFFPKELQITNVSRNLSKQGVKINKLGDDESQKAIFDAYYELLTKDDYVSDRGLTCVMGYSTWLYENGKMSEDEFNREMNLFKEFNKKYPAVYFYFPIEFKAENDGLRSCDEEYRKQIDYNIHGLLLENHIDMPFFEVRGTIEERKEYINKILNVLKTFDTSIIAMKETNDRGFVAPGELLPTHIVKIDSKC